MSWEDWTYCRLERNQPLDRKRFVNDAFFLLNYFTWAVDEYFDARGGSGGNPMRRHYDGSDPPKVEIRALRRSRIGFAIPGVNKIDLDVDHLHCLQARYADTSLPLGSRTCALIEEATNILHELTHVVFRNERFAYSIEGYVRWRLQGWLGIAGSGDCRQVSWPCGTQIGTSGCDADMLAAQRRWICDSRGRWIP